MSRISQNPNPECEYELLMFSDLSNKSEPVKFPRLYCTFKKRLTCGKNRYTKKKEPDCSGNANRDFEHELQLISEFANN